MADEILDIKRTLEEIALEEIQAQDDAEQVIIKDLSQDKNPYGSIIKSEEIRSKTAGKKVVRTRTYHDLIRDGKVVGKRQISCVDKVEAY